MSLALNAPPTPAVPDDRATEFTAVEGGEEYSGGSLLVEAYAAIWLILMAWRRLARSPPRTGYRRRRSSPENNTPPPSFSA